MGTEESIIYSYDLATVPSVLPAFANAKDIIVCDEVTCRSGPPFVSLLTHAGRAVCVMSLLPGAVMSRIQ